MSPKLQPLILAALLAVLVGTDARAINVQGATPPDSGTLLRTVDRENGGEGGIARWTARAICPSVSGLPANEAEFILERFSEVARTVGAPLARERCSPDLYILVTADPKALIKKMERLNRAYTFGCGLRDPGTEASPARINDFIETAMPVRRWYNITITDTNGELLCADRYGYKAGWVDASHLEHNLAWSFYSAFVVVDQTHLRGVTRGQLADYVTMVSLAKFRSAHADDATILKLFDAAPQAAPAGLTDYDQALLKALYTADPRSKL